MNNKRWGAILRWSAACALIAMAAALYLYGPFATASVVSTTKELMDQTPPVPSNVPMAAKTVAEAKQQQNNHPAPELFGDLRAQWAELRRTAREIESSTPFDAPLSEEEQAFIGTLQSPVETRQLRSNPPAEWKALEWGWDVLRKPDFTRDPAFCSEAQRASFESRWQQHVSAQRAAVERRLDEQAKPQFRRFQIAADKTMEVLRKNQGRVAKIDHPHAWIMFGTIISDLAALQDQYLKGLAALYKNAALVDELPSYEAMCKKKQDRLERSQYTPSQPASSATPADVSRAEVEKALTALWEQVLADPPRFTGRGPYLDVRPNLQCAQISRAQGVATYYKETQPLQWYVEMPEAEATDARGQRLQRELKALVAAGVMRQARVEGDNQSAPLWRIRYGFTEAGWVVTDLDRNDFCIRYGAPQLLGLVDYRPGIARDPGLKAYEVRYTVGFRSESEMEAWARSPEVQQAFPLIGEYAKGREMSRTFLRDDKGTWSVQGARARQRIEPKVDHSTVPTEARVKELLQQRLSAKDSQLDIGRLCLPGMQSVDAWLGGMPGRAPYSVGIFNDSPNGGSANVAASQEYLDRLSALGLLSKSSEEQIPVHRGASSPKRAGQVYEIASQYLNLEIGLQGQCFDLGQPEVEVLALRIQAGPGEHAINYRARLRYAKPMIAEFKPQLVEEWAELGQAMRQGEACEGLVGFSSASGQLGLSGDRCWPVADW